MSEELAWAAGFFDGEGCSTIHLNKKTNRSYLQIEVSQCDLEVLEKFLAYIQVGKVRGPYTRNKNHRPAYQYTAFGTAAHAAMNRLWPWLSSVKRAQAVRCGYTPVEKEEVE